VNPSEKGDAETKKMLELCRWLYNDTLAYRKNAWEKEERSSRFETQNRLPQLKLTLPELKEVHSLVLQNVIIRVELAFKAFFRRSQSGDEPGYPRFKFRDIFIIGKYLRPLDLTV